MCGISAIIHPTDNMVKKLYTSLLNVQHRGQEASGILTFSSKLHKTFKLKDFGLVDRHEKSLTEIDGNMGLGHVRYPTFGNNTRKEIQPFHLSRPFGISLVHNGNIINSEKLSQFLQNNNIFIESSSDSEIILNIFYHYLEKNFNVLSTENILKALNKIYELCNGSFSCIIMINDYGLIAFRDKHGIRPLSYSLNKEGNYLQICSETVGLDDKNFSDIENGQAIVVNKNLEISKFTIEQGVMLPCIFEYIYFARPESYINNILVYNFRYLVGEKMEALITDEIKDKIDMIVPIPITSVISATALATKLNKPLHHAIVKNRYTYRTFINTADNINQEVKKISIIEEIVRGKNLLIVDDSIVRGNTSKHIITELRKAGVKGIYFACCCPPIRFPNLYGISITSHTELIAHNKSVDSIRKELDLDQIFFLDFDSMIKILYSINPSITDCESSVFTGNYILWHDLSKK